MDLFKLLKKRKRKIFFTTPSHSQKSIIKKEYSNWYKLDYSELDGFDNLQNPTGIIKNGIDKISKIYNSKQSFYLTNGSTSGILGIMLAALNSDDRVLIARNAHKAVINGLILTGAKADWILPEYDKEFGIYGQINPKQLEDAIKINNYKAFILTSPTYEGINSDIETISKICKQYGVYLIVDEAHGALLNFSSELGKTAISQGADFAVNSLHKNAGGINPIAICHIGKNSNLEPKKIQESLNLIQTTSPSYPMIALIEETILWLNSKKGRKCIEILIKNIKRFEEKSKKIGVKFLPHTNRDFTKIVLKKENINITKMCEIINKKYNIEDEIEEENSILYLTGVGTDKKKLDKLYKALKKIKSDENYIQKELEIEPMPCVKISLKEAHFAKTKLVKKEEALYKISGEMVVPYPPGRPILNKGELIQEWHLKYLKNEVEVINE